MSENRKSIFLNNVPGISPARKVEAAKAAGFGAVEILSMFSTEDRGDLNRILVANEMPVSSVVMAKNLIYQPCDPSTQIRANALEFSVRAEWTLRDITYNNTETVMYYPGIPAAGVTREEACENARITITQALPHYVRDGKTVGISNIAGGVFEKPEQMAKYINSFESPNVKAYFNVGECKKPEKWIAVLGDRIRCVRIKASDKNGKPCPLSDCGIDYKAVMSALDSVGYTGWIVCADAPDERGMAALSADMDKLFK